ncbi:DapH/DapD/GlmU-related protein [Acinetobacter venetianus]|uniref:DapH/DapD/GlmU-related protein n=1 Tax=Acinetobacter venetianus TaxID=52133 RepID=UPI003A8EF1E8
MLVKIFNKIVKPLIFTIKLAIRYKDPRFVFCCVITRNLPLSTKIPHPVGIVIGKENGVSIGERCTIMQNVTIGVKNLGDKNGPTIGDDVFIGANAVIVGDIIVGNNVKISANSFVDFNVPENSVVKSSNSIIIK